LSQRNATAKDLPTQSQAPVNTTMNDQLTDLQARLTFQEESIDALNHTVARQAQEISELQQAFKKITQRVYALSESHIASAAEEAPPPHY